MTQQEEYIVRKEKIITRKLVIGFRRKWWIIIIALILSLIAGYVYTATRKPSYTVTEKVIFTANVTSQGSGGSPYSASATQQYISTVVDFINEGVVLDRASFYYNYFTSHNYASVDDFIREINEHDIKPAPGEEVPRAYFADSIRVAVGTGTDFTIKVSYTGMDKTVIKNKVKILICAAEKEALEKETITIAGEEIEISKYFGVEVKLGDYGMISLVSNNSKTKYIILAGVIGFVLGCFVIALISLLDKKVKDREELELITNTNLLAYIDLQ